MPNDIGSENPDVGCAVARKILGHPVFCVDCPFKECVEDVHERNINKKIINVVVRNMLIFEYSRTMNTGQIAREMGISRDAVCRILKDGK